MCHVRRVAKKDDVVVNSKSKDLQRNVGFMAIHMEKMRSPIGKLSGSLIKELEELQPKDLIGISFL